MRISFPVVAMVRHRVSVVVRETVRKPGPVQVAPPEIRARCVVFERESVAGFLRVTRSRARGQVGESVFDASVHVLAVERAAVANCACQRVPWELVIATAAR